MKEVNARRVIITMRDGSVFQGCINIGSCRRLSDFLRKSGSLFLIMFDATKGEGKEKSIYFLNFNQILWVEPSETECQGVYDDTLF